MLSRRHFLIGTIGAWAVADSNSQSVLPVAATANVPQPMLPPSEQIMYSTVRLFYEAPADIRNNIPARLSWGTGFFFNLFNSPATKQSVPVIVTNKHVVESWKKCSFSLTSRSPSCSGLQSKHAGLAFDGIPGSN
jgi:hypothetical protein